MPSVKALIEGFGLTMSQLEELLVSVPSEEEKRILNAPIPGIGRYHKDTDFLKEITSLESLGLRSFQVIKSYIIKLSDEMALYVGKYSDKKIICPLTKEEKRILNERIANSINDVFRAEKIEKVSDHDTGARINWVKILTGLKIPRLEPYIECVGYDQTTEDTMSIVFGMIFNELVYHRFMPALLDFMEMVITHAEEYRDEGEVLIIPGFTHKIGAELTTLGKKYMNRMSAIDRHIRFLIGPEGKFQTFSAKGGGSIGNWTAPYASYPDFDWINFSKEFVESFDLTFEEMTDQCTPFAIEAHIFSVIANILTQIEKLTDDFHDFLGSLAEFFTRKPKKGIIGSVGMPHKPGNPWNTEGSRKMFLRAIDQFHFYGKELQLYIHEGDMGRSSMSRNIGDIFMDVFIGLNRLSKDMENFIPVPTRIRDFIERHPAMIASSIFQGVLKREGIEGDAYRVIQNLALEHGSSATDYRAALEETLNRLNLAAELKREMLSFLEPKNAIGKADELAKKHALRIRQNISEYRRMVGEIKTFPIKSPTTDFVGSCKQ